MHPFPNSLKSIKGTMGLHQIISFTTNEMFLSVLSCFCKWPEACDCFKNDQGSHRFPDIEGQRRETIEAENSASK